MEKKENKESFEENLTKLEDIVKKLENGDIPLEDAITKFNEAMTLAGVCNKTLEEATETVNKVLTEKGELEDLKVEE